MHAPDAHPDHTAHIASRKRAPGFTLIELMIVVVITGVLAAIAIPTFQGYLHKSKTTEATEFLAEIKSKQEFYRAEFNRYATQPITVSPFPNDATFQAAAVPALSSFTVAGSSVAWPGSAAFNAIGARPDGTVRFGYAFVGGLPGTAPSEYDFTSSTADHWFVARAWGDMDGDSTLCTFELMSHKRTVWFSPLKGWE